MLATIITVTFGVTTAFAAESTENRTIPSLSVSDSDTNTPNLSSKPEHGREEIEITPNMNNENGRIMINFRDGDDEEDDDEGEIDQTWYFTSYHRGADRSYNATSLTFAAKITDSNGNAVGDQIFIRLQDYYGTDLGFTFYADGAWYGQGNLSIVSGRTYYFTYSNLTSSTRMMRIRMIIEW